MQFDIDDYLASWKQRLAEECERGRGGDLNTEDRLMALEFLRIALIAIAKSTNETRKQIQANDSTELANIGRSNDFNLLLADIETLRNMAVIDADHAEAMLSSLQKSPSLEVKRWMGEQLRCCARNHIDEAMARRAHLSTLRIEEHVALVAKLAKLPVALGWDELAIAIFEAVAAYNSIAGQLSKAVEYRLSKFGPAKAVACARRALKKASEMAAPQIMQASFKVEAYYFVKLKTAEERDALKFARKKARGKKRGRKPTMRTKAILKRLDSGIDDQEIAIQVTASTGVKCSPNDVATARYREKMRKSKNDTI